MNKIIIYIIQLFFQYQGLGKTTLLRDIIRQISNGIKETKFKGMNISLVDERSEIAAMYNGIPQNDVGIKTDILDNANKSDGMKMLIRSMSPKIVCADEIGTDEDIDAINYAICSGAKGIFTAHGNTIEEIYLNPILKKLINLHIIERLIFLKPDGKKGEINKIYSLDKKTAEYKEIIGE